MTFKHSIIFQDTDFIYIVDGRKIKLTHCTIIIINSGIFIRNWLYDILVEKFRSLSGIFNNVEYFFGFDFLVSCQKKTHLLVILVPPTTST